MTSYRLTRRALLAGAGAAALATGFGARPRPAQAHSASWAPSCSSLNSKVPTTALGRGADASRADIHVTDVTGNAPWCACPQRPSAVTAGQARANSVDGT